MPFDDGGASSISRFRACAGTAPSATNRLAHACQKPRGGLRDRQADDASFLGPLHNCNFLLVILEGPLRQGQGLASLFGAPARRM